MSRKESEATNNVHKTVKIPQLNGWFRQFCKDGIDATRVTIDGITFEPVGSSSIKITAPSGELINNFLKDFSGEDKNFNPGRDALRGQTKHTNHPKS